MGWGTFGRGGGAGLADIKGLFFTRELGHQRVPGRVWGRLWGCRHSAPTRRGTCAEGLGEGAHCMGVHLQGSLPEGWNGWGHDGGAVRPG